MIYFTLAILILFILSIVLTMFLFVWLWPIVLFLCVLRLLWRFRPKNRRKKDTLFVKKGRVMEGEFRVIETEK